MVSGFIIFGVLIFLAAGSYEHLMKSFYPIKYEAEVETTAVDYAIEKELIYAIIKCESGFDKDAHSHANAIGLMQVTPDTFEWLKLYTHEKGLGVESLKNPAVNIKYGALFIYLLRKKYKNDEAVLSAYNAGDNVVKRWMSDKNISSDGENLDFIPYKETRDYVKRVISAKKFYKKLYFKR